MKTKEQDQVKIPPHVLDAANDLSAFASDEPNRFVINSVHLTKDGTEATNGRIAVRVPYVPEHKPEDFPPISGVSDECADVIVPLKPLQEAIKQANGRHKSLPILSCLRVSTIKSGDQIKVQLAATDLDTNRVLETKAIEGKYPDLAQVWPAEAPKLRVALSAEQLKPIVDYALKHSKDPYSVVFEFIDHLQPVRFEIVLEDQRIAKGVVCPLRLA